MSKMKIQVVVASMLFGLSMPAFGGPVSIQPSPMTVTLGQTFSVNVAVSNMTDLYAFEFDLGFNSLVLNATGITEGAFLPLGGPTFFLPGTIDNTFGTITFNADTLMGPVSGVSGSGVLAVVTFQAVAAGSSAININNPLFLDSAGASMSVAVQSGSVTVLSPEPCSALLLFVGLLGCAAVGRKSGGARAT